MSSSEKLAAALAALEMLPAGEVIGVGSGSTVNEFIAQLSKVKGKVEAAVAASAETERRLRDIGIDVVELNSVANLSVYFDSADECTKDRDLIKGGGAALTREKIIATGAKKFVCMLNSAKVVPVLGKFPLPVEVIPMARSQVARKLIKIGGQPVYREGVVTDNGNVILDVYNMKIMQPADLERELSSIPGVVENGLFSLRRPDVVLCATKSGVEIWGSE